MGIGGGTIPGITCGGGMPAIMGGAMPGMTAGYIIPGGPPMGMPISLGLLESGSPTSALPV